MSMCVVVYIPLVGLICVARFGLDGQCEGLTPWNEQQELAPRSFFIWIKIIIYRFWSHAG